MMYSRQTPVDQHHQTYTTDAISTATATGTATGTGTAAAPVSDDVSDDVIAMDETDVEGHVQGQTESDDAPLCHLVNLDSSAHGTSSFTY